MNVACVKCITGGCISDWKWFVNWPIGYLRADYSTAFQQNKWISFEMMIMWVNFIYFLSTVYTSDNYIKICTMCCLWDNKWKKRIHRHELLEWKLTILNSATQRILFKFPFSICRKITQPTNNGIKSSFVIEFLRSVKISGCTMRLSVFRLLIYSILWKNEGGN